MININDFYKGWTHTNRFGPKNDELSNDEKEVLLLIVSNITRANFIVFWFIYSFAILFAIFIIYSIFVVDGWIFKSLLSLIAIGYSFKLLFLYPKVSNLEKYYKNLIIYKDSNDDNYYISINKISGVNISNEYKLNHSLRTIIESAKKVK